MERSTKRMKVFMPTYFIVIISLLYGQLCNCQDITTTPNQKDDEEGVQVESFEEFIPTKEWQTVKSGEIFFMDEVTNIMLHVIELYTILVYFT